MKEKNKTSINEGDVMAFLNGLEDEKRKVDSFKTLEIMSNITNEEPKMWGGSIVGFGDYHYKYESGREGDFFKVGFSPRKQNLTLYIMAGFDKFEELMSQLGKYKTGKSCLYIKKIEDVDIDILKELVTESYKFMTAKYG